MKSNNSQDPDPLPPEFELPHEAVIPETERQTTEAAPIERTTDADIVSGIIELADKEEYVDEP